MFQGQQIKIYNTILKTCHMDGWILDEQRRQEHQKFFGLECQPFLRYQKAHLYKYNSQFLLSNTEQESAGRKAAFYEGATVLPPKIGFYDLWVATLDFASLYVLRSIQNSQFLID
jgi:hypothetical protein